MPPTRTSTQHQPIVALAIAISFLGLPTAKADAVTEWNIRACEIVTAAGLETPQANRVMAITHTAAYEAANAITRRYPVTGAKLEPAPGASVDAAITAAHRAALTQLVPLQRPAIDSAYQAALSKITDGPAKTAGVAVGEKAAATVLAMHVDVGAAARESYRPRTTAGGLRPHSHSRRATMAVAQAMADEQSLPVSTWTTATPDQCPVGARLQRDQTDGWQEQSESKRGTDRHCPFLGGDTPADLSRARA